MNNKPSLAIADKFDEIKMGVVAIVESLENTIVNSWTKIKYNEDGRPLNLDKSVGLLIVRSERENCFGNKYFVVSYSDVDNRFYLGIDTGNKYADAHRHVEKPTHFIRILTNDNL